MALDQQKADQKPALDQKRYEEEVVRPLRGRTAQLPDDLPTRYAVDARMTGPEIEKRLREVRAYWTNKARSASHVGQVCQAFLRADECLRAEHGDQLADPAFWRRRRRDGDRARRRATDQLAAELSGFYGDLGLLTREQLAAAAGAHPDLEADQAEQAASAAGLEVVAARELPGVNGASGVSRDAVRTLTDGLAAAGAPSVPALLHPEAGAFTLLDAFSATPTAPGGLDLAAVEARIEAVSRGRDTATSGPAKHVLGRLRTAAVQGVDLRTLSLVLLLEPARAQRAAGAVPSGLVRRLEAGRLAPREARRIVVHLLAETTAVVPTDPLTELRTLLAEGRPVAAARLLAVLDDEAAAEARRLLDARTREVEALRDEASAALRDGRPDLAEQRLRAALAVAADREDLAEELAHVPLAPVTGVEVVPDGAGVRISWTAPPSHADDAVYRVVRRTDRAPRDADDGTVVADVAGARFTTDPAPPVGRPVHYAVLAGRAVGAARSSAVAASVTVVPPVADVEIVGEPGAVVGRWRAHPDAVAVRVRRHAGADHDEMTATLRGFTDTTAVEGVEYHYEIAAVYAEQGRELVAEPQAGHGGVRADSAPVTALEVAPEQDGTEVRLRVSWRTPRGADVEIRVARTPPPGEVGALLTARVVEAWGSEIPGVPRTRDGWDSLLAAVPPGRVHVAAFTRAPAGRVRGRDAGHDLVPAPTQLRAQRRGEDVVLSWVWPTGVAVAEIGWSGGGDRTTRARYRDTGGFHLPAGVTGVVEVRAVVGAGPDRSVSAPVAVRVEAPARPVRYTVAQQGSRLRGTRECVVSVPPGQGSGSVDVVLVASEGRVMPLTPGAGVELVRHRVELSSAQPTVFSAPLPRMRRPYWLRCFSCGDDVALVDPPVSALKVS